MPPESSKIPPYSEEAERAVLGSILLDYKRALDVCSKAGITAESFYVYAHQVIYDTINGMDGVVDILTVGEEIRNRGNIDLIGGSQYLDELVDKTPTEANVEHYAEIVRGKEIYRSIIQDCREGVQNAFEGAMSWQEVNSNLIANLTRYTAFQKEPEDVITENIKMVERAIAGELVSIPTPWDEYNRKAGGAIRSMLIMLAGMGGSGKSHIVKDWATFLAKEKNMPVGVFPFEDHASMFYHRQAGHLMGYSSWDALMGRVDLRVVKEGHDMARSLPCWVDDRHQTIEQLCLSITMGAEKHGWQIVFLDALKDIIHKLSAIHKRDEDERILAELARLAHKLKIPILINNHVIKCQHPRLILSENDVVGNSMTQATVRQLLLWQKYIPKKSYFERRGLSVPSSPSEMRDEDWQYALEQIKTNYSPKARQKMIFKPWLERVEEECNSYRMAEDFNPEGGET